MEPEGLLPIQNSPPPVFILSQILPVRTPSHVSQIRLNIILPYALEYTNCLLPSGFPIKTLYAPLLSPPRVMHALDYLTH